MLLKILIIIIKIVVYCQNGVLQQQLVSDLDKTWCGLVLCFKVLYIGVCYILNSGKYRQLMCNI